MPITYRYTGPWDVILQPQFAEETNYGVPVSNASFTHTGPLVEMAEAIETGSLEYRQIGTRDPHSFIPTGTSSTFDLTFNPINSTLIEYGINLPDGPGTIEKSLTFLKSQLLDGVEHFHVYTGCRADSIDISVSSDSAVEISMSFIAKEARTPSTTMGLPGTPVTHTGGVAGEPWTNITPGVDPLRWNNIATDTNSFSCSVTNNLEPIKPNGMTSNKDTPPTLRNVEWEFTTWYYNTALIADVKTLQKRPMEYRLSTTKKLVFVDAYPESISMSDNTTATEHKTLSVSGRAKAVSCVTY